MSYRADIAVRESAGKTMQIARDSLACVTGVSDPEIELLMRAFAALAGESRKILGLTCTIVEYIEDDSMRSVLPTVQALASAGINFVESRLEATHGILATAAMELKLLRRLSKVARAQSGLALRARLLAMMTNIEMGRLGRSGAAFEHLAGNLSKFSTMLSENTNELECRTDARQIAVEATNRVLASEVPCLAGKLASVRIGLGDELTNLEAGLAQLGSIPAHFKAVVEEIAEQIAVAVAAIQSYDITRQQMEHAQEAIGNIAIQIRAGGRRENRDSKERARACLGLTIQIYQLRQVREAAANWMARIRDCVKAMLKISASALAGISQIVSDREREISARLAHMDVLECESKARSGVIRRTVGEHSTLLQLVDEQLKKAALSRQTLHLLSLNTIIEADRLGEQANAVLVIGSGISNLSQEWGRIADQSGQALQEISELVERIDILMAIFSEGEERKFQQAQMHARAGLLRLHATSEFAARQAGNIELGLEAMKIMGRGITKSVDILDAAYRRLDDVLDHLHEVQLQFEADPSNTPCEVDREEIKRHFSASYTTEVERQVLQAALGGTALPPVHRSLEGNGVELF